MAAKRAKVAVDTYKNLDSYLDANKTIAPLTYSWYDLEDEGQKLKVVDPCPTFLLDPMERDIGSPLVGTRIRVINMDSFDAAIAIERQFNARGDDPPVAVVNFMNPQEPGGGFWAGSPAQEEQLCYRSTLYPSLELAGISGHLSGYGVNFALYHPRVGIIRSSEEDGFRWFDPQAKCPIVAVISVAALHNPKRASDGENFARPKDAEFTLNQIRLILRIAKRKCHTRLVLGALGCGAFNNPNRRIAELFRLALLEEEFRGGWWEAIWFAVYDKKVKDGCNYLVFKDVLEGLMV